MKQRDSVFASCVALCIAALIGGCEGSLPEEPSAAKEIAPSIECDCQLRSWVVAGKGRHLVLLIDCPDGFDEFDGAVEFTSEALRADYVKRRDADGALVAPRVARMTRGVRLRPVVGDPDERVEASWLITVAQAAALQADRVWETPYVLVGSNSNSAMVAALRGVGLEPPERVVLGGGVLGEFPGVDQPLGALAGPE